MEPIMHSSANMVLGAPKGMPNCISITATMLIDDETRIMTAWRPSEDELRRLNEGQAILLYVMGGLHPPVWIEVDSPPAVLQS